MKDIHSEELLSVSTIYMCSQDEIRLFSADVERERISNGSGRMRQYQYWGRYRHFRRLWKELSPCMEGMRGFVNRG